MLDELQRLRRKQYDNSVAGNGYFISKTHKDGNGKYAPLKVDRVRNRIRDMFKRHNISYQKAKEDGGEAENQPKDGGTVRICAHYIRGHVESVCYRLAEDPSITTAFPSNAMIANAGHQVPTFHQSYSRPMIPRQMQSFKNHRNSSELPKEEAQLV